MEIKQKTDIEQGLSLESVMHAKHNTIEAKTSISYGMILKQHVFSLFNMLNVFLAACVFITGSYKNMLFMGVVLFNMVVGLIGQIHSKRMLDSLALLNASKARVLREGQIISCDLSEIVENDILIVSSGDQVVVDGLVVQGSVEVNESMLTGESEYISKHHGDPVWSGCYVVAGQAKMQVLQVGQDTVVYKILKDAKRHKKYPSQLRDSMNKIIKVSMCILIPTGALLFIKAILSDPRAINNAILSTVAAVVGMIPEGLILLTSVALAMSAYRLAKQKVLVQELYCIETLARVDTICFDKTGTLSLGKMEVSSIIEMSWDTPSLMDLLARIYGALDDDNATAKAIRDHVGVKRDETILSIIPFSSKRKSCAVEFADGMFYVGAYEYIIETIDPEIQEQIKGYTQASARVLAITKDKKTVLGFVLIQDVLREDIKEILDYFLKEDVDIKVISGDDINTVQSLGKQAGLSGSGIDLSKFDELDEMICDHTFFGRVLPSQKKQIVELLQRQGKVVAMVGDGVNDVMALKQADCSIAMGSGSDATKNISSLVLLEDQFEALPEILLQGRRVIHNISRTSSLFLVKTLFSFGLSVLSLAILTTYPFEPIQLTLISSLATGIPSFVLTLEPNDAKVKGNFIKTVFRRAIPGAISVVVAVFGCFLFSQFHDVSGAQFSTMCTYLAGYNALCVLYHVCRPFTKMRLSLVVCMSAVFALSVIFMPSLFSLVDLHMFQWVYVGFHCLIIAIFLRLCARFIQV